MPSVADADSLQPMKGGMAMAALEGVERGPGGAELLKLAAAQRMNTDARRAAFCIVMGSEDYIDASDRLLRLPLKVPNLLSFKNGVYDLDDLTFRDGRPEDFITLSMGIDYAYHNTHQLHMCCHCHLEAACARHARHKHKLLRCDCFCSP